MVRVAWNDLYAHPLPEGHRFPMEKYTLIPEQLLHEGTVSQDHFFSPTPLATEQVLSVHDKDYWHKLTCRQIYH